MQENEAKQIFQHTTAGRNEAKQTFPPGLASAALAVNENGTPAAGVMLQESKCSAPAFGEGVSGKPENELPLQMPERICEDTLFNKLESITPTSTAGGLSNSMYIMLKLLEAPDSSMKNLRKLTGLSEDGLVKRIMAMKKVGLVAKVPGKRLLMLTEKSKKLIEESRM